MAAFRQGRQYTLDEEHARFVTGFAVTSQKILSTGHLPAFQIVGCSGQSPRASLPSSNYPAISRHEPAFPGAGFRPSTGHHLFSSSFHITQPDPQQDRDRQHHDGNPVGQAVDGAGKWEMRREFHGKTALCLGLSRLTSSENDTLPRPLDDRSNNGYSSAL